MKETAVSRNIKNFRDQKGWSQQQLADELNRSRGTISKWETDKETPNMEALIQLSSIFEVSIDYLVGHHHQQEAYVKEFNRLYQLQKTDDELLEVVDY
ncbi:MAG: helix-turn-helix domain-containing protein [Bacillota bacterium]